MFHLHDTYSTQNTYLLHSPPKQNTNKPAHNQDTPLHCEQSSHQILSHPLNRQQRNHGSFSTHNPCIHSLPIKTLLLMQTSYRYTCTQGNPPIHYRHPGHRPSTHSQPMPKATHRAICYMDQCTLQRQLKLHAYTSNEASITPHTTPRTEAQTLSPLTMNKHLRHNMIHHAHHASPTTIPHRDHMNGHPHTRNTL